MLKEADVAMPEERISGLETKVDDHTRGIGELSELIRNLDAKVDRRFDVLDQKFSHRFTWVIGLQVTMLLALLTGSLGLVGVLLTH